MTRIGISDNCSLCGFFFFLVCALNRLFEDILIFLPFVDCVSHLRREWFWQGVT